MKRIILVCAFFMVVAQLLAQNCTFVGHVKSPIAPNKQMFLLNANTGDVLDTAVVVDSVFTFEFSVPETFIGYVQMESKGSRPPFSMRFIAEPGTVTGDLVEGTLSGTPSNDRYNEVLVQRKYQESVLNAITAEYRATYLPKSKEEEIKAKAQAQFDTLKAKARLAYEENKNTSVGALCLEYMIDLNDFDYEELQKMYAAEVPIVTTFLPIVNKMTKLRMLYNTAVGKHFVDLDLIDQKSGETVKLSDYIYGKVALVDFWASWCRPCRAEIPNVADAYKKYGGDDFVVIGLNVWDTPERQAQAIKDEKMTWPQLSDTTKVATDTYGVDGIPQIMLIGKDGTILARDLRGNEIEVAIKKALK